MNLFSAAFIIFIIALLVLYYTIFRKKQWVCLLLFSIAFYAYSGISNLIFMAVTGVSVFMGGIWLMRFSDQYHKIRKDKSIDRARRKEIKAAFDKKRRMILWTIIVINFGMLAVLKYLHPFFEGFLIPLGISFYMFISIGYLVDIYFEKYEAEKNPFRFLLFVSFFPQLIQGPINRYDQMKEQLYGRHTLDWYRCKRALILILFGLLKKYTIANLLVHEIANILDAPTEKTPGSAIVFAILLYSAQQYADFSGGIDIVMGVAELFGIKMMPNFRQPYFSVSLGDFWRRWHITLGAWLKDYVFYPISLAKPVKNLAKKIKKKAGFSVSKFVAPTIALFFVWLSNGIWHGPHMNYIFYGMYYFVLIVIENLTEEPCRKLVERFKLDTECIGFRIFQFLKLFVIVNIGEMFFRADTVATGFRMLRRIVTDFHITALAETNFGVDVPDLILASVSILLVFVVDVIHEKGISIRRKVAECKLPVRWSFWYAVILLVVVFGAYGSGYTIVDMIYAAY